MSSVTALGLDETLFVKRGKWRTRRWSTSIVDVQAGQLLDVVQGRGAGPAVRWLAARGQVFRDRIEWATLDMSGPYRAVFDRMLPDATQVADPFHLVAGRAEAGGETPGPERDPRAPRSQRRPAVRARKLLVLAQERLDETAQGKLTGLLRAGDPNGEVAAGSLHYGSA